MNRKVLVNEIIDFCLEYKVFKSYVKLRDVKAQIDKELRNAEFVESLINTIIVKTKKRKRNNNKKIRILLIELEKIRLEMEYEEEIENV